MKIYLHTIYVLFMYVYVYMYAIYIEIRSSGYIGLISELRNKKPKFLKRITKLFNHMAGRNLISL